PHAGRFVDQNDLRLVHIVEERLELVVEIRLVLVDARKVHALDQTLQVAVRLLLQGTGRFLRTQLAQPFGLETGRPFDRLYRRVQGSSGKKCLPCRPDHHALQLVDRALRGRIKGPDGIYVGIEQLDANAVRFRKRVDVDDAAAYAELTGAIDPVDPFVSHGDEILGQRTDLDHRVHCDLPAVRDI